MDETLSRLQVVLSANSRELETAMSKAEKATASATNRMKAGLDSVENALRKVGKVALAAISVKALTDFGKACVELGSDLDEVQNVVNVTFEGLSDKVDGFAKSAAKSFGLSELSAKQYASTMGSMLKSMGLSVDEAYDMSTSLAGLAGDMASFYNIDADTAFQKLRSGISGETEPLKQLGINMSQANLEAYALSKGITQAYQSMDQAQQAVLRYNYLLEATSDAQGDFARTSDGWANQVRILSLQFDSLKASIGQGLIMALTPVLKVINDVVAGLVKLGNQFKLLMADITGTDISASSFAPALEESGTALADMAEQADGAGQAVADSMDEAGDAVERFLFGFDEIHKVGGSQKDSLFDTSSIESLEDSDSIIPVVQNLQKSTDNEAESVGTLNKAFSTLSDSLRPVVNRMQELSGQFRGGFFDGLGGTNIRSRVDGIVESVRGIGSSLLDIFTDDEVVKSANNCFNRISYALGQVAGSAASVGLSIGENLTGGLDQMLEQDSPRIKKHLTTMFDIRGDIASIFGNLTDSTATILEPIGGENGQGVTANILSTFSSGFMSIQELADKTFRDILTVFSEPITLNDTYIASTFDKLLGTAESITGTLRQAIQDTGDTLNRVYDEYFAPTFDKIAQGFTDSVNTFITAWNADIQPVLDDLAADFQDLYEQHIEPFITNISEMVGKLAEDLGILYTAYLKPLFDNYLTESFISTLKTIGDILEKIGKVVGDLLDTLGGGAQFIGGGADLVTGLLTLDMDKIQQGQAGMAQGALNVGKGALNGIWDTITGAADVVASTFENDVVGLMKSIMGEERIVTDFNGFTNQQTIGEFAALSGIALQENEPAISQDDMYNAMSQALADTDGERDIYLDGDRIASIMDRSNRLRNIRVSPAMG